MLSAGGGALAASHYLITSTKQISPRVLKKLKGNRGPAGPAGPQGPKGPPGADGVTLALYDFKDLVNLPAHNGEQTVATLPNIPAGTYVISAKLNFQTTVTGEGPCYLRAGGDFDESNWVGPTDNVVLAFIVSHTYTSTGSATLSCDDLNNAAAIHFAKIAAVQFQNVTRSSQ